MAILEVSEAKHFCAGYRATGGHARGSFRKWSSTLPLTRLFSEGTPHFNEYRDITLREVERLLFIAASHYRRSFDLLTPSASAWAHVTLYYGAFYSAHAILGTFGTWILKDRIIHPIDGTPGAQRFQVKRVVSTYRGSHRQFWEYFYSAVPALTNWIDPPLRFAITPVAGNPTWQTDTRNELNYDTFEVLKIISSFQQVVRYSILRKSLPGVLNTQFHIMEALLQLATKFAREFRIATDALETLEPSGNRKQKVRALVSKSLDLRVQRHVRKSVMW